MAKSHNEWHYIKKEYLKVIKQAYYITCAMQQPIFEQVIIDHIHTYYSEASADYCSGSNCTDCPDVGNRSSVLKETMVPVVDTF